MREKQGSAILEKIKSMQDVDGFRDLHWEGTFEEYLEFVRQDTNVARSAFQRLYDMIVSHGYEEYTYHRETLIHYYFFDDPFENGKDAIFGIDKPLMFWVFKNFPQASLNIVVYFSEKVIPLAQPFL